MSTSPCGSFAAANAPDPHKHVNYNLGMVLGVDDLRQEFAYLYGRNQWLARSTVGYGTLTGLRVSIDIAGGGASGPRIVVTSGVALTPTGDLVCVRPAQCAFPNNWLASHRADLDALPAGNSIKLYLTLARATRLADPVAIPGAPCRSDDQVTKPSRVADGFDLDLSLKSPLQLEEEAMGAFVAWLNLTLSSPPLPATVEQFEAMLRAAFGVGGATSPPSSPLSSMLPFPWFNPESPLTSPLASPPAMPLLQERNFVDAAIRIWVTEIRPRCHALGLPGGDCCNEQTDPQLSFEQRLLLAEVQVPITPPSGPDPYKVDSTRLAQLTLDERRRPLLLDLRLQQELLSAGNIWMR